MQNALFPVQRSHLQNCERQQFHKLSGDVGGGNKGVKRIKVAIYLYENVTGRYFDHFPVLEIPPALGGLYLAVAVSLPQAGLLWVVEPLDPDHHAGAPRLPQALHSAHVGQLGPAG